MYIYIHVYPYILSPSLGVAIYDKEMFQPWLGNIDLVIAEP